MHAESPMEAPMSANPVTWFEIYVEDMPRAKSFYERRWAPSLKSSTRPRPR
jgi:predicted enzyme related to lactoylglutathione lyase